MPKSHAHITFCVMIVFLPLKLTCLSTGTQSLTWVPSIAPMQSYKKKLYVIFKDKNINTIYLYKIASNYEILYIRFYLEPWKIFRVIGNI